MSSSSVNRYSEYDNFARIHSQSWGPQLIEWVPEIEKMIEQHLPEEVPEQAKILDLCCGTGELAQGLQTRGYQVTGLDGSEEMLRYARQNAPDCEFILDDARFFELPSSFHGVISTNFGLNHVINLEELTCIFHNVHAALLANGVFIFDLRLDEHYKSSWHDSMLSEIEDEYVWTLLRCYNFEERIGQIRLTIFQLLEKNWQRSDNTWLVKGYFSDEVQSALKDVGFTKISIYDAERDYGHPRRPGGAYFVCQK